MSFLAKLRSNQTPSRGQSSQLSYLLSASATSHVSLSLYISRLDHGTLIELVSPYSPLREHLLQPPSFLSQGDVTILSTLVESNPQWLKADSLDIFPSPADTFLVALLKTRRCFVERPAGGWACVSLGQSYRAEPRWRVDSVGVQALSWCYPQDTLLWLVNHQPYAFDPKEGRLLKGDCGEYAIQCVAAKASVKPGAVQSFLDSSADTYTENDLPLPTFLPHVSVAAELNPIVVFSQSIVRLGFRYRSSVLCFTRFFLESARPFSIWDGGQLLTIEPCAAEEQKYYEQLRGALVDFESNQIGTWQTKQKNLWQHFLLNQREPLEGEGYVFLFERGFQYHFIRPDNWSVNLEQLGSNQWQFELSFDAEGQRVDVCELLKQLRTFNQIVGQDSVEINLNGQILLLPSEQIQALSSELSDMLAFDQMGGPIPLGQIHRLKQLKDQLPEGALWSGSKNLLEQSINLHSSPIMLDPNVSGVKAELRPYQWLGVCWIQHLKQCGFNGLLADDMGLGKTLQALTHLSLEYAERDDDTDTDIGITLIVAPTSLLSNWASELRRFCPHLSFAVVHGGQRHKLWDTLASKKIVITSYPLVVRDLEFWQQQSLHWLILDEAQVIKNAKTKASQALRGLQANHKLCLSGTPVENHLGELWSILDFLHPNLLGSQRQFKEYYQKPIELDAQQHRFTELLSRVEPFILRRTKTQVAKDLPPKTQIKKMVTLGDDQIEFYEKLKCLDQERLNHQLESTGNQGQKQILLLTALTRLRQACCDPLLLGDDYLEGAHIASAKTEFCLDMLEELVAEGRSVLVFSQFTSMLDILAGRLDDLGLTYQMLTGKSKHRQQLVDDFQAGKAPIFLISLKAGGVGLNLTRADTVIHFDPWWNVAAEEQASDRAHRIGQENPVFVYKLIAEDTIEEKIALLQERKSLLSRQVNQQAQVSGESFALKLEDLLALYE